MDGVLAWTALGISVINSLVIFLLMREVALMKMGASRRSGLRFDSLLPDFEAASLAGQRIPSSQIRRTLLLFVSPNCGPCEKLIGDLRAAAEHFPPLTVAISSSDALSTGAGQEFVSGLNFVDANRILVDEGRRIFGVLSVPVTPFAYVINGAGRIRGSGAPGSAAELRDMAKAMA